TTFTPIIDEGYKGGEHKPTPTKDELRTLTKFCQDHSIDNYQKENNNTARYRWIGIKSRCQEIS
ncbi:hypothetical protein LTR11_012150, partial [Exophiala xenobiotica]